MLTLHLGVKAGLIDFNHTCETYAAVFLPSYSIIANITEKSAQALPKVGLNNYTSSEELKTPVFLTAQLYDLAKETIDTWSDSEITRAGYGYAMIGFWAIVLILGSVNRIAVLISNFSPKDAITPSYSDKRKTFARFQLWVKYWLTTPALFSRRTAENVRWCTVPPRLQSLTIFAFVTINVVACCVSYNVFDGNL